MYEFKHLYVERLRRKYELSEKDYKVLYRFSHSIDNELRWEAAELLCDHYTPKAENIVIKFIGTAATAAHHQDKPQHHDTESDQDHFITTYRNRKSCFILAFCFFQIIFSSHNLTFIFNLCGS